MNPAFTIWSDGLSGSAQDRSQTLLCGDYACLEQRHGLRPVFRRAAPSEERALYFFFDPTSGRWLVTVKSPFEGGTPESLWILARSEPAWTPLSPMEVHEDRWEVLASEDFLEDSWQVKQEFRSALSFQLAS